MSVADKVAVASLLQAKRVSGSSVPEVIAICSQYLTGDVLSMHLFAPSTAIDYVRDAGEVCRQRIIEVIGKKKLPFFIGTDTSDRAGSIATYIISYVLDDVPMKKSYSFERVEETTAPALADGIFRIAKVFEDAEGSFLDSPVTHQMFVLAAKMELAFFCRESLGDTFVMIVASIMRLPEFCACWSRSGQHK